MLEAFDTPAHFTPNPPPIHVASALDSSNGSREHHEAGANVVPESKRAKSIFIAMDALGLARDKFEKFLVLVQSLKSEKNK
ncbi:MAG: hypothetical protein KBC47_01490 [Candidatus Peribacteraceae bacterium]|nr:hypothetical protein [Candidatus Peribacteraceae bacterium]